MDWARTDYEAYDDLEHLIFLPLTLKYKDYKQLIPHQGPYLYYRYSIISYILRLTMGIFLENWYHLKNFSFGTGSCYVALADPNLRLASDPQEWILPPKYWGKNCV